MKFLLSIIFFLFLSACDSSDAKKNDSKKQPKVIKNSNPKIIKIATEEYAPFISPKLKDNGFLAILVTEAFAIEGVKAEFEFLPAIRSYESTKSGEYDASVPWALRNDRLDHFYYGEPLIESDQEVFFFLENNDFEWDPEKQDYSLLKGKTIGAIAGANYGPKFMQAEKEGIIKVDRVTYTYQNLRKLVANRIDLMISPEKIALHDLKNEAAKNESVNLIKSKLAIEEPVEYDYLIISKNSPNGEFFNKSFNQGLIKLKSSGRYKELYQAFIQSLKN